MTASISRREFVRLGTAATAAVAVSSAAVKPLAAAEIKAPLGLQLYSVRELLPKDFDGTLAKLAAMGYKNVEAAGYYNKTAAEWRSSMDKAGLRCTSGHHALPLLKQHEDEYIEFAHAAGLTYLICSSPMKKNPSIPGPMTLDDWHWVADEFDRIGAKVKAAGLTFGYHNHVEVFATIDGAMVYNELISRTDPKLLVFEMDCGWVKAAGQDPLTWLTKTPERFPLLHVKDMVKGANGPVALKLDHGQGLHRLPPDPARGHGPQAVLRGAGGVSRRYHPRRAARQDAEFMKNFRF